MNLHLNLDESLSRFSAFTNVDLILNQYYNNYPIDIFSNTYENKLRDRYPYIYELMKVIKNDLSMKDMWFIANRVYLIKGVEKSFKTFCNYIGLTCEFIIVDETNTEVLIGNLELDSIGLFFTNMEGLLNDLILINKYEVKIDNLKITYNINFVNDVLLSHQYVNQTEATILREI